MTGVRLEVTGSDGSQAYVVARELISQIVGRFSARAAAAAGSEAFGLREFQARYSRELQSLGMAGGVSVEQVLTGYPRLLANLRGEQ